MLNTVGFRKEQEIDSFQSSNFQYSSFPDSIAFIGRGFECLKLCLWKSNRKNVPIAAVVGWNSTEKATAEEYCAAAAPDTDVQK